MFDPHLSLFIRLLSLFHVVTPPLAVVGDLAVGIRPPRLEIADSYDMDRGADQFFWRPEQDVNWARGLFFQEQHFVPGASTCLRICAGSALRVFSHARFCIARWHDAGRLAMA